MRRNWFSVAMTIAVVALLSLGINSANAATISQDFESESSGSTTPPAGWSLISVAGTSSYVTSAGAGGAGLGGQITGNHTQNGSRIPAGYVVNSGGSPFDTTQPITGSFDFRVQEAGNYSSAMFMIGDIQTGVAGNDAGEWVGMLLREQTFGARAEIIDGANTGISTDNNYRISSNTWYTADFTWTPTSGTTGDFSYSVDYSTPWTATYNGFTFNSQEAYFGFGTGGYYGADHTGTFDNISITGTELGGPVVILETDFTGRTVSGKTAGNISWTTNGVADPGDLTFVPGAGAPTGTSLFDTANAQGHFAPDINVDNEGPWSLTIPLSVEGPGVVLESVILDWQHFNNSGAFQGVSRPVDWTVSVTGSSSGELDSVVASVSGTSGLETITFTTPLTLSGAETWLLKLNAEGFGGGNNTGLDAITVMGQVVVPEPSAFALAGFGLLGLGWCGRRRRRR